MIVIVIVLKIIIIYFHEIQELNSFLIENCFRRKYRYLNVSVHQARPDQLILCYKKFIDRMDVTFIRLVLETQQFRSPEWPRGKTLD